MSIDHKPALHAALLIAVLSLHILVGLRGIGYGLPYLYEVDEIGFVDRSVAMVQRGSLDPGRYNHPGSTTYYSLAGLYALLGHAATLFGAVGTTGDFVASIDQDPTPFYLSGRLLTLALATVSLVLTYLIARRLFSPTVGLLAVLVCGSLHLYLSLSTLIRTDFYMTTAFLAMFLLCAELARRPSPRTSLMAGAALGLAVSSKFPAAVFYLVLLATNVAAFRTHGPRAIVSSVVLSSWSAAAAVLVTAPFMLINWRRTLAGITYEARDEQVGGGGEGPLLNLAWYISEALGGDVGWPGVILAALGAILLLRSRRPIDRILAVTPLWFIVCISFLGLRWERWILPVAPLLAVLMAYALARIVAQARHRHGRLLGATVGLIVCCAVLWPLAGRAAGYVAAQDREDTRTVARGWILANVPQGSSLLVERHGPQLPLEVYRYREVRNGAIVNTISDQAGPNIYPRWEMGYLKDKDELRRRGVQYVLVSGQYDKYLADKENFDDVVRGYERIFSVTEPVMVWRAEDGPWRGPTIRLLKVT